MFVERWFMKYMAPRIEQEGLALHEYTEPINTRIFRKADALSRERREEFQALRDKYRTLSVADMIWEPVPLLGLLPEPPVPNLPLRNLEGSAGDKEWLSRLPDDVLDATALRPLMEALIAHYRTAIAEFDHVFGERA